jgi:SAM-dependent methyltransferase
MRAQDTISGRLGAALAGLLRGLGAAPARLLRRLFGGRMRRFKWDREYARGKWDYIHQDVLESDRFDAMLVLIGRHGRGLSFLEIGCGEGLLPTRLPSGSFSAYLGIDVSGVAIERANLGVAARGAGRGTTKPAGKAGSAGSRHNHGPIRFRRADMETFAPQETFGLIIFNESLYYSKDPLGLLDRYRRFLNPGGLFILSLYDKFEGSGRLMEKIGERFEQIDALSPRNEKGTWHCRVYRP